MFIHMCAFCLNLFLSFFSNRKNHSFLLDCGSGTAAQINRFYGDEAPEIFRRLRGVFVSHMHLDHHIGLPEMFRWRKTYLPASREPLRLFCPFDDLKAWLLFYSNKIEPIKFDVKFINNDELVSQNDRFGFVFSYTSMSLSN